MKKYSELPHLTEIYIIDFIEEKLVKHIICDEWLSRAQELNIITLINQRVTKPRIENVHTQDRISSRTPKTTERETKPA